MYRGTTPTIIFKLESTTLNLNNATEIWVTLKTSRYNKTFDITRCTLDNIKKTVSITLTQAETLELPESSAKAQIRILLDNGTALATNIVYIDINEILKGGVIA